MEPYCLRSRLLQLQTDSALSLDQVGLQTTENKESQVHEDCAEDGLSHLVSIFRIVDRTHHGLVTDLKEVANHRQDDDGKCR